VFVGLIDTRWEPPWEPEPEPRRRPHLPVRLLAWVAGWCWLLALGGVVSSVAGPLAGYLALLLAVGVGAWRVERWFARQYWHGLREHQP
jgi:hypothetical protein